MKNIIKCSTEIRNSLVVWAVIPFTINFNFKFNLSWCHFIRIGIPQFANMNLNSYDKFFFSHSLFIGISFHSFQDPSKLTFFPIPFLKFNKFCVLLIKIPMKRQSFFFVIAKCFKNIIFNAIFFDSIFKIGTRPVIIDFEFKLIYSRLQINLIEKIAKIEEMEKFNSKK